ncbi:MAG: aromatic ring-hydroxylating dioxygenase subunit alpha [Beijerinckiaceae bacterium]|nr:aromatic ring-hydroxylating dioxygenase subunit alpha [Beijerinckiaceae bacterium]
MKPEDNERLVRVGAGTPMGNLLRRYWQPLLLSGELGPADSAPVRARILGEDLIVFRATDGSVGIVDAFCPHRRAPMFYGRNEENGLRCVYHGWKFNTKGHCVDLPNAPEGERIRGDVRINAYPAVDLGGAIWVYMGPAEKIPPLPDYEWVRMPASHKHISKTYQESNFLQALEGGLDTSHSSFLHNETIGVDTVRNLDRSPRLEVRPTDYGYSYTSYRKVSEDQQYVRVYQYVMPCQQIRGHIADDFGNRKELACISGHVWVPVDDYATYTWNFLYAADDKVPFTPEYAEADEARRGGGHDDIIPGTFRLKRNLSNDHKIDRELQKKTYTGIIGINTQDIALQEGMGPIVDRSKEYLVSSDRAIVTMRRMLLDAMTSVENGDDPPALKSESIGKVRGHDGLVPADEDWRTALAHQAEAFW